MPGRVLYLVTDALPTTSAGYGVPYHRLLPWRMPAGPAAGPSTRGLELADGLTRQLRPGVLHAASNYANARLAPALRERYGLPVVYEVRGVLGRHLAVPLSRCRRASQQRALPAES